MKVRKTFVSVLVLLLAMSCLVVGCDGDISDRVVVPATVSFVPNVPEDVQEEDISQYYWRYQISEEEINLEGVENWMSFSGAEVNEGKGLGDVSNLIQGKTYWFALKGYKDSDCNEDSLLWEGKTSTGYMLNDRNTLVVF